MRVYLAGKISRDDWRKHIDGYRPFSLDASEIADDENENNIHLDDFVNHFGELPVISKYPFIQVTGPFFLSCDHGCYHGEKSHGVGTVVWKDLHARGETWSGCSGYSFSREEVTQICIRQIRNADVVFAYIDDPTCYGTLFELGFAKSAGKFIAVMFNNKKMAEEMWFISACADVVYILDTKEFVVECSTYLEGTTHIANLIAKGITGSPAWYVRNSEKTEEEGRFYAVNCDLPNREKYQKYLETEWWQKIRTERLKIDGFKCVYCGADKNLQVHHTDYSKGWFHEDPRQDLITLCKNCHGKRVHGND